MPDELPLLLVDEVDEEEDEEPEVSAEEQMPVELPHALHQLVWSGTENLPMASVKSFHDSDVAEPPKRGKTVGSEVLETVPLWNMKRTLILSADGNGNAGSFVKSSKAIELA